MIRKTHLNALRTICMKFPPNPGPMQSNNTRKTRRKVHAMCVCGGCSLFAHWTCLECSSWAFNQLRNIELHLSPPMAAASSAFGPSPYHITDFSAFHELAVAHKTSALLSSLFVRCVLNRQSQHITEQNTTKMQMIMCIRSCGMSYANKTNKNQTKNIRRNSVQEPANGTQEWPPGEQPLTEQCLIVFTLLLSTTK